MSYRDEYALVPDVPTDAEPDPNWAALADGRTALLPGSYMPPPMAGAQSPWRRFSALVIIVGLVSATTGGVCLTYGPGELFQLLS